MTLSEAEYIAALPRKRMGAGLLFLDGLGRALMVDPVYKAYAEIVGGTVEDGESPRTAARREALEEIGLEITPGRLLAVDWVPPRADRGDGVMLVFDGGVLSAEQQRRITLPPDELRAWSWCTAAQVNAKTIPLLARRVIAAIGASRDGTTAYLEDGYP